MGLLDLLLPPLRLHGSYIKRKGLYSYKLAGRQEVKRIGQVPLHIVNRISRIVKNKEKASQLLQSYERKHQDGNLFGHYGTKGFVFDKEKAPAIEIPDLTDFEVRLM